MSFPQCCSNTDSSRNCSPHACFWLSPLEILKMGSGIWGGKDFKPWVFQIWAESTPHLAALAFSFRACQVRVLQALWCVQKSAWGSHLTHTGTYQTKGHGQGTQVLKCVVLWRHPWRSAPSDVRFPPKELKENLIYTCMVSPIELWTFRMVGIKICSLFLLKIIFKNLVSFSR